VKTFYHEYFKVSSMNYLINVTSYLISRCIFVGYGAGGRLGIGGTDSVMVPTLLESIQHVFIKKVIFITNPQHFYDTVKPHLMLNDSRI
jgi:hypothetical protein